MMFAYRIFNQRSTSAGERGRSRIRQREKSTKVQTQQSLCQCQEGSLKNRWTFRVSLVASAVMQVYGRKSRGLHLSLKCFQDKKKKKEWRKNPVNNYNNKNSLQYLCDRNGSKHYKCFNAFETHNSSLK